jgi:hypothetical protein
MAPPRVETIAGCHSFASAFMAAAFVTGSNKGDAKLKAKEKSSGLSIFDTVKRQIIYHTPAGTDCACSFFTRTKIAHNPDSALDLSKMYDAHIDRKIHPLQLLLYKIVM